MALGFVDVDSRFIDDPDDIISIPTVFIYDRSAALDEGDDQKEALLYPVLQEEVTEADKELVTTQINLIGQLMGLGSKLEQEMGGALPAVCRLRDVSFFYMHIGKYTISLKRPPSYPESAAKQELRVIYGLFQTFYGGFSTSNIPTTESKLKDNPDKVKAKDVANLLTFLSRINRPQAAECVGAWILKTSNTNQLCEKSLASSLSLLLESLCATHAVVGILAMVNGNVLLTKNLKSSFTELLTLVLSSELSDIGAQVNFVVGNVTVVLCYLGEEHLCTMNKTHDSKSFYAMIHIHGDLSLTLLVQSDTDPLSDDTFQRLWRRPCTRLKDELLHIYHAHSSKVVDCAPEAAESSVPSIQTYRLHKPSNTVYCMFNQATADLRALEQRRHSNATLWQDWYMKSQSISQQAFSDMPSITEIHLESPADAAMRATQGVVNNTFAGIADVKNAPMLSNYTQ